VACLILPKYNQDPVEISCDAVTLLERLCEPRTVYLHTTAT